MAQGSRFNLALATACSLIAVAGSSIVAGSDRTVQTALAPDMVSVCTPQVVQKIFAGVSPAIRVSDIPHANGLETSGGTRFVEAAGNVPAYCEVTGTFVTNAVTGRRSSFVATLPANWNGKYLQFGCGGNCGRLLSVQHYTNDRSMKGFPLFDTVIRGYASFATDSGHAHSARGWATKAPGVSDTEAVLDFGYRAAETLASLGKKMTTAFYGNFPGKPQKIAYSYFNGCSGGGRDAFVAASRFPEAFDGIIAGDPYADPVGQAFHWTGIGLAQIRSENSYVPNYLISRIPRIVEDRCDKLDGVEDGLIQNPAACNFRPERDLPICDGTKSRSICFTREQAQAISVAMSAVTDEAGNVLHTGFPSSDFGNHFKLSNWPADISALEPFPPGQEPAGGWQLADPILRQIAFYDDSAYHPRTLVRLSAGGSGSIDSYHAVIPARLAAKATERGLVLAGDNPADADRLIRGNRKFLIWQDMSDGLLTPYSTINYYKRLAAMHGGYKRLQKNIRLFAVPGADHCRGRGAGPKSFDALTAMEDWAEKGRAPEMMIAELTDMDEILDFGGTIPPRTTVMRSMPLCKFPIMARYSGKGDINDAASWSCPAGDMRMLEVGESGKLAGVIE